MKKLEKKNNYYLTAIVQYQKLANLEKTMNREMHNNLNNLQKQRLLEMLKNYKDLLQERRGMWKGTEIVLYLKPNTKPYLARAYSIPLLQRTQFKKEFDY